MPRAHLPPISIILVYNLEQVPSVEAQACFLTGDETVAGRVIIEVAFNKYLSTEILEESRDRRESVSTGRVFGRQFTPPCHSPCLKE